MKNWFGRKSGGAAHSVDFNKEDIQIPFIKNADIRAGKLPGWPLKPETNGDPLDPDNLERTDASMYVSDGMVMRNVATMNSAEGMNWRRSFLLAVTWGGWLLSPFTAVSVFGADVLISKISNGYFTFERSQNEVATPIKTVGDKALGIIQSAYQGGIAHEYELTFLKDKMGWPKVGVDPRKYNIAFEDKAIEDYLTSGSDDNDQSIAVFVACRRAEDVGACLSDKVATGKISTAGALYTLQNRFSVNDNSLRDYAKSAVDQVVKTDSDMDQILGKFLEGFRTNAKGDQFCASENYRFAQIWNVKTTQDAVAKIKAQWADGDLKTGKDGLVEVDSIKELISHTAAGDAGCNHINAAAFEVDSGALGYLLSVSTRYRANEKDQVATALYLLGDVGGKRPMDIVGCINCGQGSGFDEALAKSNAQKIIPGLNVSGEALVSAFAESSYVSEGKGE